MDIERNLHALQSKIENLKIENKQLNEELLELSEYTKECDRLDKIYGKTSSRGGYFGRMRNIPEFKEQWRKTSFWKYHSDIDHYCSQPLDIIENLLKEYRCRKGDILATFTCKIVAYCEMAVWTPKGPVFHLIDPFAEKEILVSSVRLDEMNKYIGRIICMSCIEMPNTNNFQVTKVERLPYSLYDKL